MLQKKFNFDLLKNTYWKKEIISNSDQDNIEYYKLKILNYFFQIYSYKLKIKIESYKKKINYYLKKISNKLKK